MPMGEAGDAETFHDFPGRADLSGGVPREEGPAHGGAHEDNFLHGDGEIPVDGLQLGNVADDGPLRTDGNAIYQHFAREDANRSEDDAQEGALTGTTGTQEANEVAGHDLNVQIREDGLPVVAAGDIVQGHDGGAGGGSMGAGMEQGFSYWGYMAVDGPEKTRDESRLWKGETSPPRAPIMVIILLVMRPR